MNFVCIVFELGDKMLTLSSMENLIVQCNQKQLDHCLYFSISLKSLDHWITVLMKLTFETFLPTYRICSMSL